MFTYFYGNTVKNILFKMRKDLMKRLKMTVKSHGLRKSLK